MDYQELLFANAVRTLASELRTNARNDFSRQIKSQQEERDHPARHAELEKWDVEHTISDFIPAALNTLFESAEIIRAIKSSS